MKLLLFFFRWCGGIPAIDVIHICLYYCAEINRSYYSHGSRYHYNLRLYAHVMPVFSIDAPAVVVLFLSYGLAFGIVMPAYSRTEGYGRTFVVP